jgi:pyridinium-3,5-bisthiocarboxylic acid mononucleotide nickel chelatase
MSRVMYFDCFSGVAGDMVLGALLDAGLPLDALRAALGSLSVGHELRVTRVLRAGLSATHVEVHEQGDQTHTDAHTHNHGHSHGHPHGSDDHAHGHSHDHSHDHGHGHRSLREIAHLIGHSSLSAAAKARAVAMFRRLAEAEAAIHSMPVDEVHLHEVGALDSIIDISGVAFGLEWFGIDDIVSSPLNVGGGTVFIAHGTFPVPAPATLRLLHGVPVYSGDIQTELVTPTGALVMSEYAKSFGPMPALSVERIGYGAGTKDFAKVPNVLRVVIGERAVATTTGPGGQTDAAAVPCAVLKIECEIDDMSPQLFGPVSDTLFAAGALDVFLTPIFMKKGRPGTLLTVLAPPALREALCAILFRETTTLGVRVDAVERETLDREWVDVEVDGGLIRIKVAKRRGEIVNAAPEFEDCVRVAAATGRPIKTVQADAMRAWGG